MNRHIFISYAREDQPYVRRLAADLQQRGFEVWLDDRIDFGDRWWRAIVQAIRDSAAVIVIMTPEAEESRWVEREILLAEEEQKPILPLLLRGQKFSLFVNTQYIDVLDGALPPPRFYSRLEGFASLTVSVENAEPDLIRSPQATVEMAEPAVIRSSEPDLVVSPRQPFEPELVLIPAGEFLMGSDPEVDKKASKEEQPQHRRNLPDYYIGKTPVTQSQYAAFVQSAGHRPPYREEDWARPYNWTGAKPPPDKMDHPVVLVSWHDAVAYCRWLAQVTGRPYRLPTEAEWEKAARGQDGRIYPWGHDWDPARCNTYEGGPGGTTPVGAYPPGASPYGVLDMAGNVWEWCATRGVKEYPYHLEDEWTGAYLEGTSSRMLRGGSWLYELAIARVSDRSHSLPDDFSGDSGFRVVVAPVLEH